MTQVLAATTACSATGISSSTTAPSFAASAFPHPFRPSFSSFCCARRAGPASPPPGSIARPHGVARPARGHRGPRPPDRAAPGTDRSRAQRPEDRSRLIAAAAAGGHSSPTARSPASSSNSSSRPRSSRGARRPLPGHRRRTEAARHHARPRRQPAASAVRSKAPATRPSRHCSTAGRSSTSCRTA